MFVQLGYRQANLSVIPFVHAILYEDMRFLDDEQHDHCGTMPHPVTKREYCSGPAPGRKLQQKDRNLIKGS